MTKPTLATSKAVAGRLSAHAGRADVIPGGALRQVVFAGLALRNSAHDVHCGLTVVPASRAAETVAATDDVPVRVDWLQHELRQGPGLDALPAEVLVVTDLAADRRWPDFGRSCVSVMNLRSMVSIRISLGTVDRASLNFYSSEPGSFDHLEMDAALSLARSCAPGIKDLIAEFREPLLGAGTSDCSRVAVALGTIMARYRVNSTDAFDLLSETRNDHGRALLDVAIETVISGQLPEEAIMQARGLRGADSQPREQHSHTATSSSVRNHGSGQPAHPVQERVREAVLDGPFAVGDPEMWRHTSPPLRIAAAGPADGNQPVDGYTSSLQPSPWRWNQSPALRSVPAQRPA